MTPNVISDRAPKYSNMIPNNKASSKQFGGSSLSMKSSAIPTLKSALLLALHVVGVHVCGCFNIDDPRATDQSAPHQQAAALQNIQDMSFTIRNIRFIPNTSVSFQIHLFHDEALVKEEGAQAPHFSRTLVSSRVAFRGC